MTNQMLSLQEAAFIARKSSQTIRRLIKTNKLNFRRRRTPQGFIYFVEKTSLMDYFDLMPRVLPDERSEIEEEMDEENVADVAIKEQGCNPAPTEATEGHRRPAPTHTNEAQTHASDPATVVKPAQSYSPTTSPAEMKNDASGESSKKSVFNAKIRPSKSEEVNNGSKKADVYNLTNQDILTNQNREHADIQGENTSNNVESTSLINQNQQESFMLGAKQLEKFAETISNLVNQHNEDKKNLYAVINNYQGRIKQLEDQVKMLNSPTTKKWYQFWK